MKIISSRAAKEAIDGDNQKLFIDLLSLMSHQDLADTEVVVPVKHTINIVKKTNLSKDKEDLERINSLKIESSRASELMIENSNRLQLESLLFKILKVGSSL